MKLEVYLTPEGLAPGSLRGLPVIVIDILRTTTTIAAAIAAGVRGIYPVASTDEALRLKRDLGGDTVLAGERRGLPVPGFDLGNSPREMTPERVRERRVVLATTNGTPALVRAAGARRVLAGAAVNFDAVAAEARTILAEHGRLVFVCAGREGRFAMEDAYAAGRFVVALKHRRRSFELDDGAQAAIAVAERWGKDWLAVLERSAAALMLTALGLGDDVAVAGSQNLYDVVPQLSDGVVQ